MKRKGLAFIMAIFAGTFLAACSQNKSASDNENGQRQAAVTNSKSSRTQVIKYKTTYNERKYTKEALVYLPKNYQAKKKHNILYLLHGSTEVKMVSLHFIKMETLSELLII